MDEPFLLVFQQRRVGDADMKPAVTVSYLNVSLSGKVRQQLADVLQPAQPLKHISMLMDVRCRLQKHALDLLRSSYPPPRFIKLTLHARRMEQATVKYKQLKLIEERGGGRREWESGRVRAPPVNLPVLPISSSQEGFGRTASWGFYFILFFTSESCERYKFMWNGNRKWVTAVLRMWHSCPDAEMGEEGGGATTPKRGCQGTITTEQEK